MTATASRRRKAASKATTAAAAGSKRRGRVASTDVAARLTLSQQAAAIAACDAFIATGAPEFPEQPLLTDADGNPLPMDQVAELVAAFGKAAAAHPGLVAADNAGKAATINARAAIAAASPVSRKAATTTA